MCMLCEYWDNQNGGCKIHNTIPGGCKDFRSIRDLEEVQKLHAKIAEMKNTIDCLADENTKLYKELQETAITDNLPDEPIAVAEFLINRTLHIPALQICDRTVGDKDVTTHNISELRQIAEHLLVYCNNNKDEG